MKFGRKFTIVCYFTIDNSFTTFVLYHTKIRQIICKQGRPTKWPISYSGHEARAINKHPAIVRVFLFYSSKSAAFTALSINFHLLWATYPSFVLKFHFARRLLQEIFHGQIEFTSLPSRALQSTITHGYRKIVRVHCVPASANKHFNQFLDAWTQSSINLTAINPALVWWEIFTALLWWGMTHPMSVLVDEMT